MKGPTLRRCPSLDAFGLKTSLVAYLVLGMGEEGDKVDLPTTAPGHVFVACSHSFPRRELGSRVLTTLLPSFFAVERFRTLGCFLGLGFALLAAVLPATGGTAACCCFSSPARLRAAHRSVLGPRRKTGSVSTGRHRTGACSPRSEVKAARGDSARFLGHFCVFFFFCSRRYFLTGQKKNKKWPTMAGAI